MLWDSIFNFFVIHVFGGVLMVDGSPVRYSGTLGGIYNIAHNDFNELTTSSSLFYTYVNSAGQEIHMSLGNYLSMIATIISLIILVVICCLFIKKMVSTITHLMDR